MNRLSIKLGFWSATGIVVVFIVYTICFVAILFVNPLFTWTNMADYVVYTNENGGQFFKETAQYGMLLFGPLYVVLLNAIYDYAAEEKKILARISVGFGVAFAVLIGIGYFWQLSVVKQGLAHGELDGLVQLTQANPASAGTAVIMLGVTLFLGLSSLFLAPLFTGGRLEKVIKIAFFANGIFCLVGGIGYIYEIVALVFLTITFGMGGAVMIGTATLSILFRRMADHPL